MAGNRITNRAILEKPGLQYLFLWLSEVGSVLRVGDFCNLSLLLRFTPRQSSLYMATVTERFILRPLAPAECDSVSDPVLPAVR